MGVTDGSIFANISDRTKNVYLKLVQKQFPKNQLGLSLCKRDSKFLTGGGTKAFWYLWTTRNPSAGTYPDGGPFPNPGQQNGVQASAALKNHVIALQFEEKIFFAAESDPQSFVNEFDHEIKGGMDDLKNEVSRQWWNDGTNTLGSVASASGTTITLSATAVPRYSPLTRFIQPNGYYTFVDGNTNAITNATNVQVTAVSDTNGTLTVAAAVATAVNGATGTVTVVKGNASQTGGSAYTATDTQGLRSIANTTTIYGVNPATGVQQSFQVATLRTGNEDPTESMLSIMKAKIVLNGPVPKVIVTDPLVQARYGNLITTYKRYTNTTTIKGGVDVTEDIDTLKGPDFAGVGPILIDNNCPLGVNSNTAHLCMFEPDHLFYQQAGDIHWRNKDGNILRGVTGSPAYPLYQAELVWFSELCSDRRNAFAMHTNVNQQV